MATKEDIATIAMLILFSMVILAWIGGLVIFEFHKLNKRIDQILFNQETKVKMEEKIHNCDKCSHCKGEIENGRPDCEFFDGDFENFIENCPQMNSGQMPEERKKE